MSERTDYTEFKKEYLENWLELCHEFFDGQNVPRTEGGAVFSVYGRLHKYSVLKNDELATLRERVAKLENDLHQQTHEAVGAEMSRDAWKEFALHQTGCAVCADSVRGCEIGVKLWKETGEFEE